MSFERVPDIIAEKSISIRRSSSHSSSTLVRFYNGSLAWKSVHNRAERDEKALSSQLTAQNFALALRVFRPIKREKGGASPLPYSVIFNLAGKKGTRRWSRWQKIGPSPRCYVHFGRKRAKAWLIRNLFRSSNKMWNGCHRCFHSQNCLISDQRTTTAAWNVSVSCRRDRQWKE